MYYAKVKDIKRAISINLFIYPCNFISKIFRFKFYVIQLKIYTKQTNKNIIHKLYNMSNTPVPIFGNCPRIIYEDGVSLLSLAQSTPAVFKNLTHVSKLIFKNGETFSSIQCLFMD